MQTRPILIDTEHVYRCLTKALVHRYQAEANRCGAAIYLVRTPNGIAVTRRPSDDVRRQGLIIETINPQPEAE